MSWHLAELNVGRILAPTDDPVVAEFMDNLDRINALAEQSAGFVWRLQTDDGNATSVHAFSDPMVLLNLSVWESVEALGESVYRSGHVEYLRRKREWFAKLGEAHLVLWWVPAGHEPTIDEAIERLEHLRAHGPSHEAFTFRTAVAPPGSEAPMVVDERNACPA